MLRDLFRRGAAVGKNHDVRGDDKPVLARSKPGSGIVHVNLDALDAGGQKALHAKFESVNELPIFKGHVEHAYSKRAVADIQREIRCGRDGSPRLRFATVGASTGTS